MTNFTINPDLTRLTKVNPNENNVEVSKVKKSSENEETVKLSEVANKDTVEIHNQANLTKTEAETQKSGGLSSLKEGVVDLKKNLTSIVSSIRGAFTKTKEVIENTVYSVSESVKNCVARVGNTVVTAGKEMGEAVLGAAKSITQTVTKAGIEIRETVDTAKKGMEKLESKVDSKIIRGLGYAAAGIYVCGKSCSTIYNATVEIKEAADPAIKLVQDRLPKAVNSVREDIQATKDYVVKEVGQAKKVVTDEITGMVTDVKTSVEAINKNVEQIKGSIISISESVKQGVAHFSQMVGIGSASPVLA